MSEKSREMVPFSLWCNCLSFASFFKFMHAKVYATFIVIRAFPYICVYTFLCSPFRNHLLSDLLNQKIVRETYRFPQLLCLHSEKTVGKSFFLLSFSLFSSDSRLNVPVIRLYRNCTCFKACTGHSCTQVPQPLHKL